MALVVREATREEVAMATEWAAKEGWNPGKNDSDVVFATAPESFFVAEKDGEVIGSISAYPFGDDFGFIGFFIVKPEHRSHQVGIKLGERALDHLAGRNVGIDGVEAKVQTYRWLGFQLAYRNIRFECPWETPRPDQRCFESEKGLDIVPAEAVEWKDLVKLDAECFGVERERFLLLWLREPESRSFAALQNGKLVGYGKTRKCHTGDKYGPIFANSPAVAEELYLALRRELPEGEPHYIDVPEVNEAGVALVRHYGMKPCFQCARMYSARDPELPTDRIFGVTSFELG